MLRLYRKAPDPGHVETQKRYIAIDDTHVSVTSTRFHPHISILLERRTDGNRISQVTHHRGACRLISLGLHRIESVSSLCRMLRRDVHGLVNSLPVEKSARSSSIGDPSDREVVRIGEPGGVGDDEEVKALACET